MKLEGPYKAARTIGEVLIVLAVFTLFVVVLGATLF